MKFICSKHDLLEGILTVQKAIMPKASLPILEGIYIEADEKIRLVGNCFDLGIEYTFDAEIIEKGSVVLGSKIFGEIIRRLPDFDVLVQVGSNMNTVIECENSYYEIKGMSSDGYPLLPEIEEEKKIIMEQERLREMIKKVIYAISNDENRKILTGMLLSVSEGDMTMVALDGFRLAISMTPVKEDVTFRAVIPGKNMNEIQKILEQNDKAVKMTLSKNQALFEIENCRIISKIIDGEYMNYKSFIPEKFETVIEVEVNEIMESIERAALISSDEKKYPVKMTIKDDKMMVSSNTDVGISKMEIDIKNEGNDMTIGFNPRYMLEAMKAIDEKRVKMAFSSSIGPCVIKPEEGEKFIYMVLPVRMK